MSCEDHFRICSPLSNLPYEAQLAHKREVLQGLIGTPDHFVGAAQTIGYRKKIEYSFFADEQGLALAFFERGGRKGMQPLGQGCALASVAMNRAALGILELLNRVGMPKRTLKSLILIESKSQQKVTAALFIKDLPCILSAKEIAQAGDIDDAILVHSDYRSPASVVTAIADSVGVQTITENIFGVSLTYPFDGFFQNNLEVFIEVVRVMDSYIEKNTRLVDLYCGVGTIGIVLGKHAGSILGIEVHQGMVDCAIQNAERNNLRQYAALAGPVEKLIHDQIASNDTVVVDPPRSGLHQKVITALLKARPRRILYLSCNPETQARDLALLTGYRRIYTAGFDMYPGTLHMESLVVLEAL
jgi:23S rRNA (uracil1939-C5)-methyltransferase